MLSVFQSLPLLVPLPTTLKLANVFGVEKAVETPTQLANGAALAPDDTVPTNARPAVKAVVAIRDITLRTATEKRDMGFLSQKITTSVGLNAVPINTHLSQQKVIRISLGLKVLP